ncbi:hypothetical protein TNCV_3058881 [Trichonephila clavipes]|nr:hypothetical protein TNCV_3058881 [Trichonephila clavipes]
MKGDLFGKLFQSYLSPSSTEDQKVRSRRAGFSGWNLGKAGDFCSMFGCHDCVKKLELCVVKAIFMMNDRMNVDLFFGVDFVKLSPSSSDDETGRRRREDLRYIFGRSSAFCNMFGCEDCSKEVGDLCCKGYLYDQRSKECRYVLI